MSREPGRKALSDVTHPVRSRHSSIVAVALIAALMAAIVMVSPRAVAQDDAVQDLPFHLQSGLVTARLDSSGQYVGALGSRSLDQAARYMASGGLPFHLQSGLKTAHLDPSGRYIGVRASRDLPFHLQSGLVTAHLDSSGRLVAGRGVPFYLQSGLASAHLDPSGRFLAGSDLPVGR